MSRSSLKALLDNKSVVCCLHPVIIVTVNISNNSTLIPIRTLPLIENFLVAQASHKFGGLAIGLDSRGGTQDYHSLLHRGIVNTLIDLVLRD